MWVKVVTFRRSRFFFIHWFPPKSLSSFLSETIWILSQTISLREFWSFKKHLINKGLNNKKNKGTARRGCWDDVWKVWLQEEASLVNKEEPSQDYVPALVWWLHKGSWTRDVLFWLICTQVIKSLCVLLSFSDLEKYLPQTLHSAAFKVSREGLNKEEAPLQRLKRWQWSWCSYPRLMISLRYVKNSSIET